MTTIVTTVSKDYATMFADSGITGDYVHPDMNKIINQNSWLIAVCGEDRICDVLQYLVKYPEPPKYLIGKPDEQWFSWLATRVVPLIAKSIEKNMHKSYWGSIGESQLLLVTHGNSFLISDTLGVGRARPYWSIGSGSFVALGYLAGVVSTSNWGKYHARHARKAVEIAKTLDPYTRGDVYGYKSYSTGEVEKL